MLTKEMLNQLNELLIEILPPIKDIDISLDTNLIEVGLNSLLFIRLVVMVEDMYGIEFMDEDLDLQKFRTLRNWTDYIKQHCVWAGGGADGDNGSI